MAECSICLEAINTDLLELNCMHSFHSFCMYDWIIMNNTCPMCRAVISDKIIEERIVYELLSDHTTKERKEKIINIIPNIKVYLDIEIVTSIIEFIKTKERSSYTKEYLQTQTKENLKEICKKHNITIKYFNKLKKMDIIDKIIQKN